MAFTVKGGSIVWDSRINNDKLKKDGKDTGGILNKLGKSISSADIFAGLGVSAALAFKHVVDVNKEFEKSLSSLQSILGLTKDEMTFFKDASVEMGANSTKTSQQVVEAFKLIGSQKPELLQSKEALKEVTQQAIILSEAAEIDVPQAAAALTGALNQMGLAGSESGRVINSLAAGAKFGASAIPLTSEALKNFGSVANSSNVTLEESVGLVQTLAEKQIFGAEAGTNLRNIILKLKNAGLGFVDGQFDINAALEETRNKFDAIQDPVKRSQEQTKLFGLESATAANILLENTAAFEDYTKKVTGTTTALEQQRINTDNLAGDISSFNSAVEKLVLSFNGSGGLNEAIREVVQFGTQLINRISEIGENFDNTSGQSSAFASILTDVWGAIKLSVEFAVALIDKFAELGTGTGFVSDIFNGLATVVGGVLGVFKDMTIAVADLLGLDLTGNVVNNVDKLGSSFGGLGLEFAKTDDIASRLQNNLSKIAKTKPVESLVKDKKESSTTDKKKSIFEVDISEEEIQAEYDKINELELQQQETQKENTSKFYQTQFEAQQEFDLNKFMLLENDAEKIKEFEEQQEIDRLQRKLNLETGLTDIQRSAIESRIDLLQKEETERNKFGSVGIAAAQNFANVIGSISRDSNKSAEENAEDRKAVLLNGLTSTLNVALSESLALLFADAVKKGGIFGLVGVPLILGGAKALFNTLIPKFAEGGVIPEGHPTDSYHALLKSNEVVSNGRQQANLLHRLSNTHFSMNDSVQLSQLMKNSNKTNELLRNQKNSVVYGNKLLITNRNGMPTDEVVSLS